MASIFKRKSVRLGNIVQSELYTHIGFARKTVAISGSGGAAYPYTYNIGEIVVGSIGDETFHRPTAVELDSIADGTLDWGIFIGADFQDDPDALTVTANDDERVGVIIWRGPIGIGKKYLIWPTNATNSQKDAVYTAMEAKQVKLLEQI